MTRLGILVSGRGSNLRAIIDACKNGGLNASVEIVISNHADSGALRIAKQENIRHRHLSPKRYPNVSVLDQALTATLDEADVDLVILAGYMQRVGPVLLKQFRHSILNIHPSLLPNFGGKGMYGLKVHQAVIDAGESETGATVHIVNVDYDQGRILAQKKVAVDRWDTAESLAGKVLAIEHQLYAETINTFIQEKYDENDAHPVARSGA